KAETYYVLGKKKLAAAPDNPKAMLELAIQAGELKKYLEAVEHFEHYLQKIPNSHVAYFNLATCYLELERFAEAYQAGKKAKELAPDSNEALLCYAGASLCFGHIPEAIVTLEGLLAKNPDYPVAMTALAAGYCLGGQKGKGVEILRELWKRSFDCNAVLHSVSKKLVAAGSIKEAKELLHGMIESKHIHPETRAFLAQLETRGEGSEKGLN
ncbi:MAG: hypothetical protein C0407_12590, partial [Desulfobacca sp.]|nr:hypothetical protein [Desulfobacca sp.]